MNDIFKERVRKTFAKIKHDVDIVKQNGNAWILYLEQNQADTMEQMNKLQKRVEALEKMLRVRVSGADSKKRIVNTKKRKNKTKKQ